MNQREKKRMIGKLLQTNQGIRVVLAKYFDYRGWVLTERVVGFTVKKASVTITLGAFGWELKSPRFESSGTYQSWRTLMEIADERLPAYMGAIKGHMPPLNGSV